MPKESLYSLQNEKVRGSEPREAEGMEIVDAKPKVWPQGNHALGVFRVSSAVSRMQDNVPRESLYSLQNEKVRGDELREVEGREIADAKPKLWPQGNNGDMGGVERG
ncbi:hypothetical protein ACOSQ4_012629 [Xanthoceras sorbifolium]